MGSLADFFGFPKDGCEVRFIDAAHGNGIFATKDYEKGDVIFREKPTVSFQQSYNRQEAWTCAHCGKFLGSLDEQLAKHLGLTRLRIVSNIHLPASSKYQTTTTEAVQCIAGCGEMYCSEPCREHSFSQYHHLMCVGQVSSVNHPLYQFKQHALENNELFLLAGQLIARFISLWLENGKQGEVKAFQAQYLNKFIHKYWWDMPHEDSSPEELQKMAQESITLLQSAFTIPFMDNKRDLEQVSSLFDFEFFSKLLALLETNEIAIGVTSPLERYRKDMVNFPQLEKAVAETLLTPLMTKLKQMHEEECNEADVEMDDGEEDDEEEEAAEEDEGEPQDEDDIPIFSNYEGIGIFPFTAMMNHSCEPNCQVNFDDDYTLKMDVLKPIKCGEQIMQSYIYEDGPLKDRQEELNSYGFVCDCAKCGRQTAARLNSKKSQPKKDKGKK